MAQCKDGKFSCSGLKQWCGEQMKKCSGPGESFGNCNPQCTWKCQSPNCDQACAPKCQQPICTTRCKGFNTEGCKMKCGQPNCVVVCPKFMCPGLNCAKCKTKCGEPTCNMECGNDEQPCRHVCAEPQCKWECSKPADCPKPKCNMVCEEPAGCMSKAAVVKQMPPLQPGETEVTSSQGWKTPASWVGAASLVRMSSAIHGRVSTLRVNVTTMEQDHSLKERLVELPVATTEALQVGTMWTRKIREHTRPDGQVVTSTASCQDAHFQCEGDKDWCAEQKGKCESGHAFLQQRSRSQVHLKA